MAALGGVKPKASITKGKCDIKIDCPNYKVTVNGENAGQIICANSTGRRFENKKVTLANFIQPASGAILPKGFPMLATSPMLCDNCYIHVYPWVGPSSRSLGCVGVTQKAWNKITECGGSEIEFVAMGGIKSAKPTSVRPEPTAIAAKTTSSEGGTTGTVGVIKD